MGTIGIFMLSTYCYLAAKSRFGQLSWPSSCRRMHHTPYHASSSLDATIQTNEIDSCRACTCTGPTNLLLRASTSAIAVLPCPLDTGLELLGGRIEVPAWASTNAKTSTSSRLTTCLNTRSATSSTDASSDASSARNAGPTCYDLRLLDLACRSTAGRRSTSTTYRGISTRYSSLSLPLQSNT
jgi:hypothetical protein